MYSNVTFLICISMLGVQACETCANMNKRLREVPNSIEELSDKRDWMKQIPELTRNYRVRSRDSHKSFKGKKMRKVSKFFRQSK